LTQALYSHFSCHRECASTTCSRAENYKVKILGVDIDPVLVQRSSEMNEHTESVSFCELNVTVDDDRRRVLGSFLRQCSTSRFDIIFMFSVTMWIHLNYGDSGLKELLLYVASMTTYLVVEPQRWKCYTAAQRRMKRLRCKPFEHFSALQWRCNVDVEIVTFLQSHCGMQLIETFGETGWNRKLLLFEKS